MRNKVNDYYGYNDTVSAMISKMCIEAYNLFDIEKVRTDERTAMARAIGDTFKKNIEIFTSSYSMDRGAIDHGLNLDDNYIKHLEKMTFMKFAEALFDSGHYRVDEHINNYETSFKYQLAVFKIGELK